jgi:hypothetical protein
MLVQITSANQFFRVTDSTRQWTDIISGNGAYGLQAPGNRYNVNAQKMVYASDTPEAALAEAGFYAALEWQERIGNSVVAWKNSPPPSVFSTAHKLWCFNLTAPATVIDVDNPNAQHTYQHHRLILRNPSRFYLSTQQLGTSVISAPGAAAGLKSPPARCHAQFAGKNHSNFAFVIRAQSLSAHQIDVWDLTIEFQPRGGGVVSRTTERMDWENPNFTFTNPNHLPVGLSASFQIPVLFC